MAVLGTSYVGETLFGKKGELQELSMVTEQPNRFYDDWMVVEFECIDSTNAYAKREIPKGLPQKTVVVAGRQTQGYGRSDHNWESGNTKGLWMSAVMPVCVPVEQLSQSTLVLAVAVHCAIQQTTGLMLQIKWPNDLIKEGRKYAGLLVESAFTDDNNANQQPELQLVLGVGINVNQTASDFSPELRQKAASLAMLSGQHINKTRLLHSILTNIDDYFMQWQTLGFSQIRKKWLESSNTIGKTIKVSPGFAHSEGIAVDLSEMGALTVQIADGTKMSVDSGEIFYSA